MRRGQRKLWRELAVAAAKVAESKNYAEEYFYGVCFYQALDALLATADPGEAAQPAKGQVS